MAADKALYRITYASGVVKHGHRKVLGPAVGYLRSSPGRNYRKGDIVKIERAPEPVEWTDVTSEFISS